MGDSAEVLVNRNEPIPVIVSGNDGAASGGESRQRQSGKSLYGSVLAGGSGHSLQDRLFSKLLQQVIPAPGTDDVVEEPDRLSSKYLNRPGFSLPLMTTNFRRFNARIGVVFVFQNRLLRLLTWHKTSHTLSFVAIYTFACLNPYLFTSIPLFTLLFSLFVPAFLIRHPPPPAPVAPTASSQYSMSGPPLAPARIIKPASDMSKDFFRNMRDLQNMMDDYSTVYDALLAMATPLSNFSDERLSSAIFIFLFVTACLLLVISHLLPWRFIALVVGWSATALGHPSAQDIAFHNLYTTHVRPASDTAHSWWDSWITSDILLDSAPETREVEIFELQRRKCSHTVEGVKWEPWIFSSTPWEPMAPARVAGERVKGTRFFEDVRAPAGWEWAGKKWEPDLGSTDWVEERLVQAVEVELDGERWVYDALQGASDDGKSSGSGGRGEWRRRRWIRLVRRRDISGG